MKNELVGMLPNKKPPTHRKRIQSGIVRPTFVDPSSGPTKDSSKALLRTQRTS